MSNTIQVEALKKQYLESLEISSEEVPLERLRFFCMGKELSNDLYLYSYDIATDMVVQCMIKASPSWKASQADNGQAEACEKRFWTIHNKQRT